LNGDGINDIVVANYKSNSITIFMMDKNGVKLRYNVPVGAKPDGLAIADLNGDGKADIVVSNSGDHYLTLIFGK